MSNITKSETASSRLKMNNRTRSRVQAYVELTKMRISIMVLVTFLVAAVLAAVTAGETFTLTLLGSALLGMLLIAASGNAANMYIERYSDFLMPRTAGRPLPAKRLSATEVATFSVVTFSVGTVVLFSLVNWQTGVCGVFNWILYSLIYTPLKAKHWSNTEVGAVAGAMPVLMGSLATTGTVGLIGWALFGVLFFWQFPHFMAISWKYRDQYRAGGLQMLTVTEPTGLAAGRKAIVTAILLILVSLVPVLVVSSVADAALLIFIALGLGIDYLWASIRFYRDRNLSTAKTLMRSSLLYLPLYMVGLILTCMF